MTFSGDGTASTYRPNVVSYCQRAVREASNAMHGPQHLVIHLDCVTKAEANNVVLEQLILYLSLVLTDI